VHVKVLPLVLIPGAIRRWRLAAVLALGLTLFVLVLPYSFSGPAVGAGLFDYAQRWERNALIYGGIEAALEWVDTAPRLKPVVASMRDRFGGTDAFWNRVYSWVWPREVARVIVALLALVWVLRLSFRRGLTAPREFFLALGGVLLLSPTLHPWYVLWVLPFAAVYYSIPWLLFAALVPLAYFDAGGDVPWPLRVVEYGVPLAVWIVLSAARSRRDPPALP
jgi:hypothetical protein